MKKKVIIYTDGACSGNPGPGGWGALLMYNNIQKEIYGGEIATTNNRMELMAAIKALELLKESCLIELFTDSIYVKNGITLWIKNWKEKNWRTADKKEVKNIDLWQELDLLTKKHHINWHWIKGHNGDKFNDLVDALALKGRDEMKEKI
jgi:ribonuclease HI